MSITSYQWKFADVMMGIYDDVIELEKAIGRRDSSGLDIYEGDIIHYYNNNEVDNVITDVFLICQYHTGNTWFTFDTVPLNDHDGYYTHEMNFETDVCVVGNIHKHYDEYFEPRKLQADIKTCCKCKRPMFTQSGPLCKKCKTTYDKSHRNFTMLEPENNYGICGFC